jgi:tRNA A-37 threonylcarbamoyl transferase component Bud32
VPLSPGVRLDRYEVLALIGEGAMGVVYRARDSRVGRDVAIKVLPAAYSADAERLRRFDQEARAVGTLNQSNVLTLHDVGTHDGQPYVVTELLEGDTLRARLERGPVPPRKAIEYATQIARGLAAAHAKGVVHRDLKPENLFITRDGTVKILDFGLAKLTRGDQAIDATNSLDMTMTEAGAIMGTVGYMSPEQVRGLPTGPATDIFALGCVLYEMVTGQRAFLRGSPVETMSAILSADLPDLPPAIRTAMPPLWPVIRRCVEKDPAERFESARDLAFGLALLETAGGAGDKTVSEAAAAPEIAFRRITFRRGVVWSARFTPDGHSVVYSAAWEGSPAELFSARIGNPESGTLGFRDADLMAIAPSGEMAAMLRLKFVSSFDHGGTLARIPPHGGAARELLHDVHAADWSADGAKLAVVREKDGMRRLEYPIGNVLYQTPGWIGAFRIAPDGQRIAFLDHPIRTADMASVMLVDLKGERRILSDSWGTARGLTWSRDGREVWFTADRGGAARGIYAVNLEGVVRRVLQAASNLTIHDVSSDGRVLVSHGPERAGISGRARGDSRERDLSWLDWTLLHDVTPDGRLMLLSETAEGGGDTGSVYVRPLDGSPAVRIGDGNCMAFSRDGEWVVSRGADDLTLLPTGVGEVRHVSTGGLRIQAATFIDDRRLVVTGAEPDRGTRLFVLDIVTGEHRPISPEGMDALDVFVMPGANAAIGFVADRGYQMYPLDGGEPRPITWAEPGDRISGISVDAKSAFVWRQAEIPARVHRVDLETGERTLWRELTPPDPTGIYRIARLQISSDGAAYAYTYYMHLMDLHVIEGLR